MEWSADIESPDRFRRWGAISCLAGAMERKVWVAPKGYPLYPNLFIWLVGPPGVGKSRVIADAVKRLFETLPEPFIAPVSVTSAALVDYLNQVGKRMLMKVPGPALEYNTAYILADELTTFMPKWDPEITAAMNNYWDGKSYTQWRRTANIKVDMPRVCVNMLAGTTPGALQVEKAGGIVPDGCWNQGFMSRVLLIFAKDRKLTDILQVGGEDGQLPPDLVHDLHAINSIDGEVTWDQDYAKVFNDWRRDDEQKKETAIGPTHPKLEHYGTRRMPTLLKLSLISCIDRAGGMVMTPYDFERAFSWLREAETVMQEVFTNVPSTGDARAQDEIVYWVMSQRRKTGKPVAYPHLLAQVCRVCDARAAEMTIILLLASGRLREAAPDAKGNRRIDLGKDSQSAR